MPSAVMFSLLADKTGNTSLFGKSMSRALIELRVAKIRVWLTAEMLGLLQNGSFILTNTLSWIFADLQRKKVRTCALVSG